MLLSELFSGKNGTYMAVVPTQGTQKLLDEWAKEHSLILDDNLHVTVLYSRVSIDPEISKDSYVCLPHEYAKFGKAVVMKLNCPELERRHESLINMGGTHDFDTYDVHMTFFKDGESVKIEDLPDIPFGLAFEKEYKENLEL